jgi:hypothetical protein
MKASPEGERPIHIREREGVRSFVCTYTSEFTAQGGGMNDYE